MGMDVIGQNPTDEVGEYFRNNVWWWRPLWNYCESVAPELTSKVENAQYNDGDGLDGQDSVLLAEILLAEIALGNTKQYQDEYEAYHNALPSDPCDFCNGDQRGALVRPEWPDFEEGVEKFRNPCNKCSGKGSVRPMQTSYPFDVENVAEFARFLQTCGGFSIC